MHNQTVSIFCRISCKNQAHPINYTPSSSGIEASFIRHQTLPSDWSDTVEDERLRRVPPLQVWYLLASWWWCKTCLTQWNLNKMAAILQTLFSNAFFLDEIQVILLLISLKYVHYGQISFRYWLGDIRLEAITWNNVDQDSWRNMATKH